MSARNAYPERFEESPGLSPGNSYRIPQGPDERIQCFLYRIYEYCTSACNIKVQCNIALVKIVALFVIFKELQRQRILI